MFCEYNIFRWYRRAWGRYTQSDPLERIPNPFVEDARPGADLTRDHPYSYDDPTASMYGRGRLARMTDPAGLTDYTYDRRGLLRSEIRTIGTNSYPTSYSYDANGNRVSLTSPSGRTTTYTFDFADRAITASNNGTSLVSAAAYLPFGPLTSMTLANGTTVTRTYDMRYRLTQNRLDAGGALARYDYTYNDAGDILQITDALDAGYSRTFGYDDLHRLTIANGGASLWGNRAISGREIQRSAVQLGLAV